MVMLTGEPSGEENNVASSGSLLYTVLLLRDCGERKLSTRGMSCSRALLDLTVERSVIS